MADPAVESSFPSDIFGLKRISNSFPNVSGLFVGFSAKAPSEPDSLRSPTSILDFRFLSSLSNSFKLRSPRSSSNNGSQKKWDFGEIGLGMINVLANEDEPSGEVSCLQRNDIIFGLKANRNVHYLDRDEGGCTPKSKSLPRNFRILPQAPELGSEDNFTVQIEPVLVGNFSSYPFSLRSLSVLSRSNQNQERNSGKFCIDDFTANRSRASVDDEDFSMPQSLPADSRTLPVPITQSDGYVRSLSAKEIELSEDYTCIISYGPDSKTMHIFGDCILDCHSNNLCNATKDDQGVEMHHMAESEGVAAPHPFEESLTHCLLCERKLGGEEEICENGFVLSLNSCVIREMPLLPLISFLSDVKLYFAQGSAGPRILLGRYWRRFKTAPIKMFPAHAIVIASSPSVRPSLFDAAAPLPSHQIKYGIPMERTLPALFLFRHYSARVCSIKAMRSSPFVVLYLNEVGRSGLEPSLINSSSTFGSVESTRCSDLRVYEWDNFDK